jgi:hypothetical protein
MVTESGEEQFETVRKIYKKQLVIHTHRENLKIIYSLF